MKMSTQEHLSGIKAWISAREFQTQDNYTSQSSTIRSQKNPRKLLVSEKA